MKTWLKKWWKPLVLVLVLAGFLLYPVGHTYRNACGF